MEIVFKTSVRIRYVLWLLYALLLGIGVFLVYKDGNYGAVLTLVWMLPLYTALRKNTVHFRFFCHILRISRSFPPSNSRRSRCCSPIIS